MRKGFTLIELMIVIAIIAIIAAIAIPNLLESRVSANEAAASASLKSAIFAGEVQFAGGAYQDRDQDNIGEYGTIGMLCGKDSTTKMPTASTNGLTLVQGALASAASLTTAGRNASDYVFWGMAPSETNSSTQATVDAVTEGAVKTAALATATNNCDNGEKFFCVGCGPLKYASSGRRVFMITNDGQIRSPATSTSIAAWLGSTTPTTGRGTTYTDIKKGLADGFGGQSAYSDQMMDTAQPSYPIYTK